MKQSVAPLSEGWFRRISSVVLLTLGGRFLGFLFPVILLRELDEVTAGLAFFFINAAYFVIQPVSGGPATAVVRRIASSADQDEEARWLRAAMGLMVPAIAVSTGIGVALATTSNAPVTPMLLLVASLALDILYFQVLLGRRRYVAAATYRFVANAAQLVGITVALAFGMASLHGAVAVFCGSFLVGVFAIEVSGHGAADLAMRSIKATGRHRRAIARAAIPTALTGLAYSTISGFDTYLVGQNSHSLLPDYGAAKSLAVPLLLVSYAVTTIVQPEVARAVTVADAERIRRRLLIVGPVVASVATAVALPLASPVVTLLYGDRYPDAPEAFRWLAGGTAVLGMYLLLQSWCYGRGIYARPLVSLSLGAATSLGANLILIPAHGIVGAGVALTAGSLAALISLAILSSPGTSSLPGARRQVSPNWSLVGSLLLVGVAAAVVGVAAGLGYGVTVLAALAAVVAGSAVIASERVAVVALFGVLPAIGGLDRGLGVPGLRPAEVLLLGLALVATARAVLERRTRTQPLDVGVLTFAVAATAWSATSALLSDQDIGVEAMGNVVSPLVLWLLFAAARYSAHTHALRRIALVSILASAIPVAVFAVAQQLGLAGTREVARQLASEVDSLDAHRAFYRATGLFAQGHILGAFFFATGTVALVIRSRNDQRWVHRLAEVALVASLVGIAAAATATPGIALLAAALWVALRRGLSLRIAAGGCAVLAVLWLGFGGLFDARLEGQDAGSASVSVLGVGLPQTIGFRIEVWRDQFFPEIAAHPLLGVGPLLPQGGFWEFTESQYVTFLLRGGIPLLLIFVLAAGAAGLWLVRMRGRTDGAVFTTVESATILIVVTALMCTVNNYVNFPGLGHMIFIVLGMAAAGTPYTTHERRLHDA